MIDLYYWPTPNGKKVSIMLEECGLEYETVSVNIGRGDQFKPEFLKISPNNRIPAIVDNDLPISLFESGAILEYLAEKTDRFLPHDLHGRYHVKQWLCWQIAGLGPMAGQLSHFVNYAPKTYPYALDRYRCEYDRLLGVMDRRLANSEYLASDYSIADMASYPWVASYKRFDIDLDEFRNLRHWFDEIKNRPAVRRGMEVGQDWRTPGPIDEQARKIMFGQTAESTAAAANSVDSNR